MEANCAMLQKIEKDQALAATPPHFPADCTCLKEEVEDKSTLDISMDNRAKVMEIRDDVWHSLPHKSKGFFRGGKKPSRNMWLSIDHEKKDRKNRVLKKEKSMDDKMFIGGKSLARNANFETISENESIGVSLAVSTRRGSICEEIEKGIVHDGISLYEMRKAMVIEETLKERFLM